MVALYPVEEAFGLELHFGFGDMSDGKIIIIKGQALWGKINFKRRTQGCGDVFRLPATSRIFLLEYSRMFHNC